jgi:myo-inositol-1(or 4)-monophosphatase
LATCWQISRGREIAAGFVTALRVDHLISLSMNRSRGQLSGLSALVAAIINGGTMVFSKKTQLELEERLDLARDAARRGRELLLRYRSSSLEVRDKADQGLVSDADLDCEKLIVDAVRGNFPGDVIVGEEGSFAEGKRWRASRGPGVRWLIDPLDGTTNYLSGLHVFCISIGIEVHGVVAGAVIDVPLLDRTYHARVGHGAFCDDKPLHVSSAATLSGSLLATGFPPTSRGLAPRVRAFGRVLKVARGIRRLGSAAFDLCMVAEGVYAGYWEKDLAPWDTAAGSLLVREAGGQVSRYNGRGFSVYGDSIVATNRRVHRELLRFLK